jgi:hypothetical protein
MCSLRGCLFVVDLLDVSVDMRGVSEQGLHLVIRGSFVSDWGFSFEAFSSVFFVVEAFVVRIVWFCLGERMSYCYVPLIWEHGMDVVTVGWHICWLMAI